MPKWLVKIDDDEYIEWDTRVDAPTTPVMDRDEAVKFSVRDGLDFIAAEDRLRWTDEHLCSCRARLGERVEIRNGHAVSTGGGRVAYSFATYGELHAFLLGDPAHPQGEMAAAGVRTLAGLRSYANDL